jgi:hypothetical protein
MTLVQTGTAVEAEFTCQPSTPTGTGTFDGTALSLSFDFGGGYVVTLDGAVVGLALAGAYTAPDESGTFTMVRTDPLGCANACQAPDVLRFVDVHFTQLDLIEEISLFRSSAGHEYVDGCESCRSMKHYYAPFAAHLANGVVPVRSPVAGQVVRVRAEGHGASVGLENKQVWIRSLLHPEYTFVLFHIDLASAAVTPGAMLAAGDPVGTARLVYPDIPEIAHDFDIAVRRWTPYGVRLVSWFDVVTDALFASYTARGATSRSDFVITRAARDADPLTCDAGGDFTSTGALPAWFVLSP